MTPHLKRIMEEKDEEFYNSDPGNTPPVSHGFYAGFQSACDILLPLIEEMKETLQVYGKKGNWEYIEGHTTWASNLTIQDCAMYNCGGGRARIALSKIKQTLEGE